MKEISKTLEYKDKTYKLVFNLNVMQVIQEKYGTLENGANSQMVKKMMANQTQRLLSLESRQC